MGSNSTLLCIHRDPSQLSLLQVHGYELVTATNGSDGLRLFMLQAVDAIVLDYQLGLLDGGVVAAEIKKVKPEIPIANCTSSAILSSVPCRLFLRLEKNANEAGTKLLSKQ